MEEPAQAAAAIAGTKEDGLTLATDIEDKGVITVLEGDIEKAYYVSFAVCCTRLRCRRVLPMFLVRKIRTF